MFNLKDLLNEDIYIHCQTEQQANFLLEQADKQGKPWDSYGGYKRNNSFRFGEKTCYNFFTNKINVNEYIENRVIEFQEIDFENKSTKYQKIFE